MANLQEKSFWEPGIYQLETSDPVLAGPDGIDNLQGKQLANRTVHLKERIEKLESGEKPAGNAVKLSTARKIEITGDGSWNVSFDGSKDVSGQLTLRDSGVAPGSYGQVMVDAKGRIIGARAIISDDVPQLDWSKIVSGKPTTLAGYGIADGVSKTVLASSLDDSRTLRNVEYLKATSTSGAAGRIAGINASNQLFIGDIDGVANLLSLQVAGVGVANATKDGLQLNGTPTVPTPAANAGGQQAANVAYVKSAIDGVVAGAPGALNTLKELADALGSDGNFAATVTNKLATKADKATSLAGYGIADAAPLYSPQLAGAPTAPTPKFGDNSNQIVNTAYLASLGLGSISVSSAADLNAFNVSGIFVTRNANELLNAPSDAKSGRLIMFVGGGTPYVSQLAMGTMADAGKLWTRSASGSDWTSWISYATADAVKAVAASKADKASTLAGYGIADAVARDGSSPMSGMLNIQMVQPDTSSLALQRWTLNANGGRSSTLSVEGDRSGKPGTDNDFWINIVRSNSDKNSWPRVRFSKDGQLMLSNVLGGWGLRSRDGSLSQDWVSASGWAIQDNGDIWGAPWKNTWGGVDNYSLVNWLAGNKINKTGDIVPGQLSFTESINGGSLRQNGDLGVGFSSWRTAPSFLSLVCHKNDSAYTLWKADSLARPLANCMVHARSSDSASATLQYRVANGGGADGEAIFEMLGDGTFASYSPDSSNHSVNFLLGKDGNAWFKGVVQLGSFTKATLPPAQNYPTGIAYVTDGPNGPTQVFSNGQKWRVPVLTEL